MLGYLPLRLAYLCAVLVGAASTHYIDWVDCSKHVPPPATFLNTTNVNLSSLPQTLHCGRINVPMDYSKPIGVNNNITLGLAMYRPANPKGVIFFCPGGTDAGAAAAWRVALNQTGPYFPDFSGLEDYDLMMMDIRGTWSSNLLNVSLDTVSSIFVPNPTNQSEFDATKAASKAIIQSFDELSSPPGIVQFLGINEVIQDHESIRKALKYEKINFIGLSYGSYRAQLYAAKYPHHVGHFVLDAVVAPGLSLDDQANTGILAGNRALLRADAYCQNDPSCPFKAQGRGSVPKVSGGLCPNKPLFFSSLNIAVKNSSLETFALQYGIYNELQDQPIFPIINQDLAQLAQGNTSSLSGGGPLTINDAVGIPYLCSDYYFGDNTFAGFQKSLQAGTKLDTYKIGQTAAWNIRMYCAAWPYAVAPLKTLHLKAPMLFVTADFDASTPTEWATIAWKTADHSALLVRHGDNHTTFNLPASIATRMEKEFLRTGVLPRVQNGTEVTVYHAGMCRVPIPDPYDVPTGFVAGDCAIEDECNLN
ncbi:alpha/beta-hydrolase [Mytilinidion resinicola]|uniref:Alpha/beta-hydrolase n=1 Tax=Mytilinidion resinicola TaxID=574789 RepID=A0A6A6YW11_9PEZI|nr:alpha/beta-hydrolase [Mytilinidion resinicola]KAF2812960.1 alpha/beta-hydrolase [Mytilinidion resinicola]